MIPTSLQTGSRRVSAIRGANPIDSRTTLSVNKTHNNGHGRGHSSSNNSHGGYNSSEGRRTASSVAALLGSGALVAIASFEDSNSDGNAHANVASPAADSESASVSAVAESLLERFAPSPTAPAPGSGGPSLPSLPHLPSLASLAPAPPLPPPPPGALRAFPRVIVVFCDGSEAAQGAFDAAVASARDGDTVHAVHWSNTAYGQQQHQQQQSSSAPLSGGGGNTLGNRIISINLNESKESSNKDGVQFISVKTGNKSQANGADAAASVSSSGYESSYQGTFDSITPGVGFTVDFTGDALAAKEKAARDSVAHSTSATESPSPSSTSGSNSAATAAAAAAKKGRPLTLHEQRQKLQRAEAEADAAALEAAVAADPVIGVMKQRLAILCPNAITVSAGSEPAAGACKGPFIVFHSSPTVTPIAAARQLIKTVDPDLVVVGSGHKGALSRLLLGTFSDAVARGCDCDVLVVREGKRGRKWRDVRKEGEEARAKVREGEDQADAAGKGKEAGKGRGHGW